MDNTQDTRFILLQGIEEGNTFWTTLESGKTEEEARYLADGTLAYNVLGVYDTSVEVQKEWDKLNPFWSALVFPRFAE